MKLIYQSKDLLTVDEAAQVLKVPKSWIYARTRTGEIPVRKLGRHVRIPADQLAEWVESQAIISSKEVLTEEFSGSLSS